MSRYLHIWYNEATFDGLLAIGLLPSSCATCIYGWKDVLRPTSKPWVVALISAARTRISTHTMIPKKVCGKTASTDIQSVNHWTHNAKSVCSALTFVKFCFNFMSTYIIVFIISLNPQFRLTFFGLVFHSLSVIYKIFPDPYCIQFCRSGSRVGSVSPVNSNQTGGASVIVRF